MLLHPGAYDGRRVWTVSEILSSHIPYCPIFPGYPLSPNHNRQYDPCVCGSVPKGALSMLDPGIPSFLEDELFTVHTSFLLEIALSHSELALPEAWLHLGRQPLPRTVD